MTAAGESAAAAAGSLLRDRVATYLRHHHTATVATVGPSSAVDAGLPHAATIFYATDDRLRLVFLSKGTSRHGSHIVGGTRAGSDLSAGKGKQHGVAVAVTVSGVYEDWREIQGLQIWGTAEMLRGVSRAAALATYLKRFPFVAGLLKDPRLARQLTGIEVFRVTPERVAFTDNSVGFLGREVLELGDGSVVDDVGGRLRGNVVAGRREAAGFMGIPWVKARITEILGAEPFPGTLNLELRDPASLVAWRRMTERGVCLQVSQDEQGFCAAHYYPVLVNGVVVAGIVLPHVDDYPADVVEVVSGERLRDTLGLNDGDEVTLEW